MNEVAAVTTMKSAVNVQVIKTSLGVSAWLVEDYSAPIVSVQFAFRGGTSQDKEVLPGLSTAVASLLDEGAGPLDSQAFQQALEEKAIEISFDSDRDYVNGRLRTLARNIERAGELVSIAIQSPRFDPDAVERVKLQLSAGLRREANDPAYLAGNAWRARTFGDHPYGRPPAGTPQSLEKISREDLSRAHSAMFARDGLVVAIVGAVDAKGAEKLLAEVFGGLPLAGDRATIPKAGFFGLEAENILDLDVPQTTIRFGRPALSLDDEDYIAAALVTNVLGGGTGLSSRLYREVREKRGLAYSVSASIATPKAASYVVGGTTTKNERAVESLDVIRKEIRDLANDGISAEELAKSKRYLIGSHLLRFDTSVKIAGQLVQMQVEGRSPEWLTERNQRIESVTLADARRAAARVYGDGALSVTMVGRPTGRT